jgi:DNA-binding XRE family transcriptional regulator
MNAITIPQPIASDGETITLSRAAWAALIAQIEDAEDRSAIDRYAARVGEIGVAEAARLSYTAEEAMRMIDGTPPLAVWRNRAGLSQKALAKAAGISGSYLAEIEGGKKPGSVAALSALAKALAVPLDVLVG